MLDENGGSLGFDSLTTKRVNLFAEHKECAYVKNLCEHISELLLGCCKVEVDILVEDEPCAPTLTSLLVGQASTSRYRVDRNDLTLFKAVRCCSGSNHAVVSFGNARIGRCLAAMHYCSVRRACES